MEIRNLYTSVAVNRSPSALDCGDNGLVCYAAANSIAILDPNYDGSCKLLRTYAVHSNRVNTVKWVNQAEKSIGFISGADDSLCIFVNILVDEENPKKITLKGHTDSVTSVDSIFLNDYLLVVTASADSTVRLWKIHNLSEEKTVESSQVIDLKTGICFNVKFAILKNAGFLLAFTTDDDKIKFYGENNGEFVKIEELIGHEDWVRGLDFIEEEESGDLLLASSSQDSFIRLWRISPFDSDNKITPSSNTGLIQIEEKTFELNNKKFILTLESVLQGHENWVYSVHWNKSSTLQLLSSSIDRTMIIWSFDNDLGMWVEKVRVGEVGGNTLGFYGGKFYKDGKSIIGHGFQGSLHRWHQNNENEKLWEPSVINGGHFREVKDIAWEKNGNFLLSASLDQTTRLHSYWKRSEDKEITYHEIARPQVHGYDMQCIALLSRYKFASGAEEKIIRTFQAPGNFIENFRAITKIQEKDVEGDAIASSNQKGASVPSLGLSNKIVYEEDLKNPLNEEKKFRDEYPENYFVPISMKEPPTEEYLTQNTLFPEMQKLYAHGYELFSLTANKDGTILASACKSTSFEHAEIILWDTNTWKIAQRLLSHKLTVTQMKFSSDGNRLLSVSRDRRWSLFENFPDEKNSINFKLVSTTDKNNGIHERIIWCCDWTHDDKYFATGSRDGKIAIWTKKSVADESSLKDYSSCYTINLPSESITALSFSRNFYKESGYLLAIGLDTGIIHFYNFNGSSCELLKSLNTSQAHHLTVNKLEFSSCKSKIHLASCGNDHLVRIYEIN